MCDCLFRNMVSYVPTDVLVALTPLIFHGGFLVRIGRIWQLEEHQLPNLLPPHYTSVFAACTKSHASFGRKQYILPTC